MPLYSQSSLFTLFYVMLGLISLSFLFILPLLFIPICCYFVSMLPPICTLLHLLISKLMYAPCPVFPSHRCHHSVHQASLLHFDPSHVSLSSTLLILPLSPDHHHHHHHPELVTDSNGVLSSSAGSSEDIPHSFEARLSPQHILDHILVFPSAASSSPECNWRRLVGCGRVFTHRYPFTSSFSTHLFKMVMMRWVNLHQGSFSWEDVSAVSLWTEMYPRTTQQLEVNVTLIIKSESGHHASPITFNHTGLMCRKLPMFDTVAFSWLLTGM